MVRAWQVPAADCGTAAGLDQEVARLLGGDPDRRREHVRVSGEIAVADDAALVLTLELEDASGVALGSRVLRAGDCRALADAAALLVAFAVDPGAVAEAGSAGEPELPETVVLEAGEALDSPTEVGIRGSESGVGARSSESGVGARSSESGSASRSWPTTLSLDASLFLELGLLPAPAAGVGLGARLRRRRLRAGVGLAAVLPRQTGVTRDGGADASARFFALAARLELGAGFVRSVVHFDAAAVVDLAMLSGQSAGVSEPARGFGGLVLVGALVRVLVRLRRVALGVEADLRAATTRPRFEILGLGEAHRPSALVGRVGVVLRFPARP